MGLYFNFFEYLEDYSYSNANYKIKSQISERQKILYDRSKLINDFIHSGKNMPETVDTENIEKIKTMNDIKEQNMNQFLTLNVGSSKATIDLSKVRKCGLVTGKNMFGKKHKIIIYYNDRPDIPEVNFELQTDLEAVTVYKNINSKLEQWAEASNASKIAAMQKELEILYQQKEAMQEEKAILLDVFNQFKEMMQIMEDETKTSKLVDTIKSL